MQNGRGVPASITCYRRLPEPLRLGLTSLLGVALGWVTYEVVYAANPLRACRATTSWGAAWTVSVWRQHALHRLLTFSSALPYGPSLRRAYCFATASGALGLAANVWLTGPLGVSHRAAWLVGVALSGAIGVVGLKRYVFPEGSR